MNDAQQAGSGSSPAAGDGEPVRRSLAAGMGLSTGAQVGALALSTVTSIAIARLVGPDGTGSFALVLSTTALLVMVFNLGIRQGVIFLVSSRRWSARQALRDSQFAAFVLGLVAVGAGLGLYELTSDSLLAGITLPMALAALVAVPFAISLYLAGGLALALERWEVYALFQILPPALILVLGVGLAIPYGTTGAIIGLGVANVIVGLVGVAALRRTVRKDHGARDVLEPARRPFRDALTFGSQTWIANLLQFFNYRLDLFIVNAYASTASVGVYSVAVTVTAIGWLLPNAIQMVLFSRTVDLSAAAQRDPTQRAASDETDARATRHVVILMIPSAIVLAILIAVVVPLAYGPSFSESVTLGFLLLPGVVVLSVGKVLLTITTGRGFPRYFISVSAVGAVFTVLLYVLLIPSFDAQGAAVASTLSYLFTTLLAIVVFVRATGLRMGAFLVPRRSDFADYVDAGRLLKLRLTRRSP